MAIQISGCTVIDNSRNITNANNMCVGVVTMTGSSGDIETPGTITCDSISVPYEIVFFNPPDKSTGNQYSNPITLTFNGPIQAGIGTIELRRDSGVGTVLSSYTVGVSTFLNFSNYVLTITPSTSLPGITTVFVKIPAGAVVDFNGVNVGGSSTTYSFTTRDQILGDPFGGGNLICQAGGTRWIVAPSVAQVSRSWYCRNDANTLAQSCTGCTGWFVPSTTQWKNPGCDCRVYWDTFPASIYWSSTQCNSTLACATCVGTNGNSFVTPKCIYRAIRSFRTVTY